MARQGSYPKGVAKREEILEKALEVVARVGYSGATVRQLADAVGLTQNGLLYYFGSKEQLFVEILRLRDRLDDLAFGRDDDSSNDLGDRVARFIRHNSDVPGLVQLNVGLAAEATSPDHPAHEYFKERYALSRARGADTIRMLQASGRIPGAVDPESLATIMLAVSDGLQSQWLYEPRIDMTEQFLNFWEQVGHAVITTAGHP
ncbi:TetR/AcrR family transcriptional regulator [Arthrobacter sp. MDT1-48-3]